MTVPTTPPQREDFGVSTGPAEVRFERILPGPIERVWAYLTESEKRGKWFASGPMELHAGGAMQLTFKHANLSPVSEPVPEKYRKYNDGVTVSGTVIECEPPRLLSFSWGDAPFNNSIATFELSSRDDGTVLLVVTHRKLNNRGELLNVSGGWHTHLGILSDVLNGRTPRPFWSTHAQLEAEYEKRI